MTFCIRVVAVVTVLIVLAPGWTGAQPPEGTDIPRTSWGHPDLNGVWVNGTTTPLEPNASLVSGTPRTRVSRIEPPASQQ